MEIRVLRYFLAVAREENITAAAERLHVTQPTLSKQLMELEAELGRKLFIRGNRRIKLTEDGMFLRKRAQEIVELADRTQAQLASGDELITGDVYIGGGETYAMRLIAQTLKKLQRDCPGLRFHLFSGNGEDVLERLEKGLVDFGLFVGDIDLKKYDYIRLQSAHLWGLLLRRDDELAQKDFISPEDLKDRPMLCSRQAMIRNELAGWLGSGFENVNIVGTYNLIYNASIMVEEGLGAAITIDRLVNTDGSPLCFIPFAPEMTAGISVAWKKYQVFSKAAQRFLEQLQSETGNESKNY